MIIAFDGPDGVGKSTQLQLYADFLREQGKNVYTTRGSGGTPIGEELRKASLSDHPRHAETDLYISLAMHTELGYDLQERTAREQVVLVDRSPLTVIAYQNYGSQLSKPEQGIAAAEQLLKLWGIDTLLLFTAPQDLLNKRLQDRYQKDANASHNYFESRGTEYFERVRTGYQEAGKLVKQHPEWGINLVEIDASGTINDIQAEIRTMLRA